MDLRFSISDRYWVVKLAEICPARLLDGSWPRGTTLIWELSLVFSFLQFTSHQHWTTGAGCADIRRALHYFRIPLEAICPATTPPLLSSWTFYGAAIVTCLYNAVQAWWTLFVIKLLTFLTTWLSPEVRNSQEVCGVWNARPLQNAERAQENVRPKSLTGVVKGELLLSALKMAMSQCNAGQNKHCDIVIWHPVYIFWEHPLFQQRLNFDF